MTDEELIDDVECLGGLTPDRGQAARADQAVARLHVRVPRAGDEASRRQADAIAPTRRSGSARSSRSTRRRERSASRSSKNARCRQALRSDRNGPIGIDALRDARRGASPNPSSRATDGSPPCAALLRKRPRRSRFAAARRARRCSRVAMIVVDEARRRGAGARRQLSLRAGAAGRGQDDDRLAPDRRPAAAGQARRRHVEQPQGDQQPAAGGGGAAPAKQGFTFSGVKKSTQARPESAVRGPIHRRRLRRTPIIVDRRAPADRRHGVAVRRPGRSKRRRLPLRRRGRPGFARQPRRDGHGGAQHRAARRPDAARAADPGRASRPVGRVDARLPARRAGDRQRRPRHLPRHDVPDARGRVPLHLGCRLRRPPVAGARQPEPAARAERSGARGARADRHPLRPRVSTTAASRASKPEGEVVRTIFASLLQQARIDKEGAAAPDGDRRTSSSSRRTTRR